MTNEIDSISVVEHEGNSIMYMPLGAFGNGVIRVLNK